MYDLLLDTRHLKFNPLSANPTKWSNTLKQFDGKWSNTLKQFVRNLPTNYLSVFDHFVWLALNGLKATLSLCMLCDMFTSPVIMRFYTNLSSSCMMKRYAIDNSPFPYLPLISVIDKYLLEKLLAINYKTFFAY